MKKGKDQTTLDLNFSQIHCGPNNGQAVTRPVPSDANDKQGLMRR